LSRGHKCCVFDSSVKNNRLSINQQEIYEAYNRRTLLSIQILGRIGTNQPRK
jgi:hypothetical protein